MRGLTVIGIAFIAAVGVDLGLSLLPPGQWLPVTRLRRLIASRTDSNSLFSKNLNLLSD